MSSGKSTTGRREFLNALYAVLAITVWVAVTAFIYYVDLPQLIAAYHQAIRLLVAYVFIFGFLMNAAIVLGAVGYGLSYLAFSRRFPRIWLILKVLILAGIVMYAAAAVLFLMGLYMGWYP